MKRIIPVLLLVFVLAGCFPNQANAPSDDAMATKVASILTEMPAPTSVAPVPSVTWTELPKVEVTEASTATTTPTTLPSETPLPTATTAPTETATPTVTEEAPMEYIPTLVATNTLAPAPLGGTSTPPPTLTPGSPQPTNTNDIRNKLGSPTGIDTMNNANTWTWPVGRNKFTSIDFQNGMLRLSGLTKDAGWRLPLLTATSDVYAEMTVAPQDCSGADSYGILFRVPVFREADRGYLFAINCDGQYALWKWDGKAQPDGKATMLIQWKASDKINAGSGAFNRMGVMASGDRMLLYINGAKVAETRDSTYVGGNFGIFVNPSDEQEFTIWVDEMSYWTNVNP